MLFTKTVGSTNFDDTVKNNNIIILDFWASWCGPCKMFSPIFDKAAAKHRDIFFGKVNTEDEQLLSRALNIRSIPTIMVYKDSTLVFEQSGALPEAALENLLTQVKALDMKKVRQEIDQTEKDHEQ